VKLYKLESHISPEYGNCFDHKSRFFLTDDLEKLKIYIKGAYDYELDNDLTYSHYYKYDRESIEVTLREIQVTTV
jgi:hypothetical protein